MKHHGRGFEGWATIQPRDGVERSPDWLVGLDEQAIALGPAQHLHRLLENAYVFPGDMEESDLSAVRHFREVLDSFVFVGVPPQEFCSGLNPATAMKHLVPGHRVVGACHFDPRTLLLAGDVPPVTYQEKNGTWAVFEASEGTPFMRTRFSMLFVPLGWVDGVAQLFGRHKASPKAVLLAEHSGYGGFFDRGGGGSLDQVYRDHGLVPPEWIHGWDKYDSQNLHEFSCDYSRVWSGRDRDFHFPDERRSVWQRLTN